ncbi:MAG TPA: bifunctional pyr operon transcriptional regulator/uracil phosphoribosyltransferase PyrR [Chthoniobacterales bacterium]|jgi:pyrimidine operon attenuation protein/uracil phosphoribosyltransferase|nr:bifunctional pyr operon transcriptional regulator/uracil phosphoribosyltransferase PyrR [Chthoniobacterales bacterium]
MSSSVLILDEEAIARALRRIAHEILEHNPESGKLVLAGIPLRGVALAERLADHLGQIEGVRPQTGVIDISMHRDDLGLRPRLPDVYETRLPLHIEGLTVVLVDDVLFTGRTCRAAMDAISSFGRPARIQLAVLVDRGHRELPIRPDYVGKNLPTGRSELVKVRLIETDAQSDSVHVEKP